MPYKKTPMIVQQSIIDKPVSLVFKTLLSPNLTPILWTAQLEKPMVEGEMSFWKWSETNTILKIRIKEIKPNELISTVWQDTLTTVDYQLQKLHNHCTLLSFSAYNFTESGKDLARAMNEKQQLFIMALRRLKSHLDKES